MTNAEKTYAEVVIDTAVSELDRPFHYAVPESLRDDVEIGSLVLVPFASRLSLGYVVGFPARPGVAAVKDISSVIDEPPVFDFDTQRLCRWIAEHYLCALSQAFRLVLPPGRGRRVRQLVELDRSPGEVELTLAGMEGPVREVAGILAAAGEVDMIQLKRRVGSAEAVSALAALERMGLVRRRFSLTLPKATPKGRLVVRIEAPPEETRELKLPARQREIVDHLEACGGAEFQSLLLRATGTSSSSLKSLAGKGIVSIESAEVLRRPRLGNGGRDAKAHLPNEHQAAAIDRVNRDLDAGRHGVFLLEGVTGSGKTEVYLRCIERALEKGRGAIVLVPEISLTPQTLERFESRFPGRVAVLHSRLGPGERFDQWRGIRDGRYRVVVGARSALFAPIAELGLIAVDEEHEPSYKSDTSPRYHARQVAVARARMTGAVVILGSATPSFESLEEVRAGRSERLVLPQRIDNRPMPAVEIVDMRNVGGAGEVPLVSSALLDALSRTVEAGDQAILFLNRRGFANYLQCRSCGTILGCDDCEVSLCYHARSTARPVRAERRFPSTAAGSAGERDSLARTAPAADARPGAPEHGTLMCHHCCKTWNVPPRCPSCGGGPLKTFGAGTQRVEEEVRRHLPGVSLLRMDADTTRTKDAHWRLLGSFSAGEARILIGTQMIAKGLDIPGVTLVGVINADTALALPDFRASERTYQLLTQVSGRAGRGLRPGRVIVQTFTTEHPAIAAMTGDAQSFIDSELRARRQALYPPFVDLVNLLVTSTDQLAASRSAERMRKILEVDLARTGTTILGPAPSPLSRLRGTYRWHILVKCGDLKVIAERLKQSVSRFHDYSKIFPPGAEVRVTLDVDPVSLL
jgi:primosomal protein N' (replication factor Y)